MVALTKKGTRLSVCSILKALGRRGIKSVLVEGGSTVFSSFLKERCADRVALFMAPKILLSGIPFVRGSRTCKITEAISLREPLYERVGDDFLITGRPAY